MTTNDFLELIWQKARELYREMPWRADTRPYYVLVSEIMLQQTQVDRVRLKFAEFITQFPDIQTLAEAPLANVITLWSGLGYNRRAKYLHDAAKQVVNEFAGEMPTTYEGLVTLPGVGPNTAGAILAYSFNQPVVFIETNIRTVLFHHLFADQSDVSDAQLRERLAEVVDHEHPREFYWALMDYGTQLKQEGSGRLDQSRHYKKQAALKGSLREVRGLIIKALTKTDLTESELQQAMPDDDRYAKALAALQRDGLIKITDGRLHLTR